MLDLSRAARCKVCTAFSRFFGFIVTVALPQTSSLSRVYDHFEAAPQAARIEAVNCCIRPQCARQRFNRSSSSLHSLSNSRKRANSRRASAENRPCFQRARLERASPAAVRGPVERPPCIRKRFFPCTAGQPHEVPLRGRAPRSGRRVQRPGGDCSGGRCFRCRSAWQSNRRR